MRHELYSSPRNEPGPLQSFGYLRLFCVCEAPKVTLCFRRLFQGQTMDGLAIDTFNLSLTAPLAFQAQFLHPARSMLQDPFPPERPAQPRCQ